MSKIEDSLIEKIRNRAEAGQQKYGMTMERNDLFLDNWLQHAQEEAMDLCVYLEKIITIREQAKQLVADYQIHV